MTDTVVAIALVTIVTFGYLGWCAVSPFGACRACHGFGFHMTTTRSGRPKRGRDCRRCKGYGLRLRTGRRLINFLADIRDQSHR